MPLGVSWMSLVRPEMPPNAYLVYVALENTTVWGLSLVSYIYIYNIYIERERELYIYIYIFITLTLD